MATKSSAMFIWERQIYDMFHLEPTIFVSVCLADGHDGHTSAGVPVTMAYHGPLPGELGRSDFFTCEVLS